jgi:beta-phosphoglucomutase-like phosphatase (HAD superfamily)
MNKILDYELFIFDFDGTIMDTEYVHCKAWNKAISEITNRSINLTISEFHNYFHQLNNKNIKLLLKTLFDIEEYDSIYKLKQNYYQKFVEEEDFKLINGIDIFLNMLIDNNKKFVIVTNTSNKFMDIFKK